MDEDIARWTIEFMLRSSMDDHLLKRILNVISIPNSDVRLKKTILLRAIQMERSEAAVTETLLVFFEIIEQLDENEGLAMMESMKAAYCAVAVECTVKYLAAGSIGKNGRYFDAVRRIWRGRVTALERSGWSKLVSRELEEWKVKVEAALSDNNVGKKLVNLNTRNEALKLIGDYLAEAWGVLGPSFLDLSASLMENGMTDELHSVQLEQVIDRIGILSEDVGGSSGGRFELPSQMENSSRPECQGNAPVLSQLEAKRDDRLNVNRDSAVNDGSKRLAFVAMNTGRVQELATGTMEGQESLEEEVAVLHDPSSSRRGTDMHIHSGIVSEDVGQSGGGNIELPSQVKSCTRPEHQGSMPVLSQAEAKINDRLNVNQGSSVNDGSKQLAFVPMNTERVQELATETMEWQESLEEEVAVSHDPSSSRSGTDKHIHSGIVSEDVGGSGGGKIELPSQVKSYSRPEHQGSVPVLSQAEAMINDWLNMIRDSGGNDSSKRPDFVAMNTERVQESATETVERQESVEEEVAVLHVPSPSQRENLKTSVLPRGHPLALHKRVRGGAKISHLDDLEDDSLSEKYTCLQTPEVERVREALKTSSLELQTLVKDPLPDALRIAESIAQDLAEKNKTSEHFVEDQNNAGAANSAINKDDVPLQSVNTDPKNPSHDHHTTDPRPSIMKRKSTACTDERNDSIHGSPRENHVSRLHLPSPKRKVISPLKKYEETKMVRRRKCRRWSLLEEDTLRTAVQRLGKGNWKLILHSYRDIFDERTEVDLKDKWRNMTR